MEHVAIFFFLFELNEKCNELGEKLRAERDKRKLIEKRLELLEAFKEDADMDMNALWDFKEKVDGCRRAYGR
jgi:hypothetical protein